MDLNSAPDAAPAPVGRSDAAPRIAPLIKLRQITKTYGNGSAAFRALHSVNLDIYPGEFVAIMGHSGSGKSTLMNILGCLDTPTGGTYYFEGRRTDKLDADERALLRRDSHGFIFQGFNLLARTSAIENVEIPLLYRGLPRDARHKLAADALRLVGLGDKLRNTPAELSGGQQQRVAIARALVTHPRTLFADEPTGNLDSATTREIMDLIVRLNREQGITVILVTHEDDVANYAKRIVRITDGTVSHDRLTRGAGSAFAGGKDAAAALATNTHHEHHTEVVEEITRITYTPPPAPPAPPAPPPPVATPPAVEPESPASAAIEEPLPEALVIDISFTPEPLPVTSELPDALVTSVSFTYEKPKPPPPPPPPVRYIPPPPAEEPELFMPLLATPPAPAPTPLELPPPPPALALPAPEPEPEPVIIEIVAEEPPPAPLPKPRGPLNIPVLAKQLTPGYKPEQRTIAPADLFYQELQGDDSLDDLLAFEFDIAAGSKSTAAGSEKPAGTAAGKPPKSAAGKAPKPAGKATGTEESAAGTAGTTGEPPTQHRSTAGSTISRARALRNARHRSGVH